MLKSLKLAFLALALALPGMAFAQGKIAVVDVRTAILMTDYAQQRMADVRAEEDYKADKEEFDQLKEEGEALLKKFQKDAAVMSQEQQLSAQKKLASKQADLDHVMGKLRQAEQATGQAVLQEMAPKVEEVLKEIIAQDGIGLLLNKSAVIHEDAGYSITAKVTDKLNQLNAK